MCGGYLQHKHCGKLKQQTGYITLRIQKETKDTFKYKPNWRPYNFQTFLFFLLGLLSTFIYLFIYYLFLGEGNTELSFLIHIHNLVQCTIKMSKKSKPTLKLPNAFLPLLRSRCDGDCERHDRPLQCCTTPGSDCKRFPAAKFCLLFVLERQTTDRIKDRKTT